MGLLRLGAVGKLCFAHGGDWTWGRPIPDSLC